MSEAPSGRSRPRPGHLRSFPLYVVSGLIATASHYALTIGAVELLGVRAFTASCAGFALGAVVKYALNYHLAFRSEEQHVVAVPRFAVMLALLFVGNAAFFWVLHDRVSLHYIAAQVLTTILLIPVGYVINRAWVFR